MNNEEEVNYKRIEDPVFRLLAAKQQIENILNLIKDNENESYMSLKLKSVWYELDRQLSHYGTSKPGRMSHLNEKET